VTRRKFRTKDVQILGANVQNLVARNLCTLAIRGTHCCQKWVILFDYLEDGGKKPLRNVRNKSPICTAHILLVDSSSKTPCKPQIPPVISTHPRRRVLGFKCIQIICTFNKMDLIFCNLVRAALYIYMAAGSICFHRTLKHTLNIQLSAATHTQGKLCFCSITISQFTYTPLTCLD